MYTVGVNFFNISHHAMPYHTMPYHSCDQKCFILCEQMTDFLHQYCQWGHTEAVECHTVRYYRIVQYMYLGSLSSCIFQNGCLHTNVAHSNVLCMSLLALLMAKDTATSHYFYMNCMYVCDTVENHATAYINLEVAVIYTYAA